MAADHSESPTPLAEIAHGPGAFEQFLDNNQKSLMILTVVVALGAAGWVVYRGIEKSRQHTAGEQLNKATELAPLQAVVNEHADTNAARSAAILLADQQWKAGQQDAAVTTLRALIDSNPDHPALATALSSLASKLMSQGKNADAAALYQQVVDDPNSRYLAPYALICLGDLAKAGGDLERAEVSYNRAKTEFAESGFAETATKRLASLKAKPPVEVEPPPTAPDAAAPAVTTPGVPSIVPPPANLSPTTAPAQEGAPEARSEKTPPSEPSPATPKP